MTRRNRRGYVLGVAAATAVSLALVGCSSSSGSSGGGGSSSSVVSSGAPIDVSSLTGVYSAVAGLTGDARYQKLLSLAKAENGGLSLYTVGKVDTLTAAFTKATGIKVTVFTATSEQLSERVLNEHSANKPTSDVLIGSPNDLQPLSDKGALAPLTTPVTADLKPGFFSKNWLEADTVLSVPSWNTTKVKAADVPQTYEDLFTKFKGKIGIEASDWTWFYHLVNDYFVKQKGMTVDAAVALITNGLKGATIVDGHTLLVTLLGSGEIDYTPDGFAHTVTDLAKKGAPVTFGTSQPAGMPAFLSGHAYGISQNDPHPATALLFIEFAMSQAGQDSIAAAGNQVLSTKYTGDNLLNTFSNYVDETIGVTGTAAEQTTWQGKYNDMLKAIGTKVVSK